MKETLGIRKLLNIVAVLLVVAIVAGSIWQSRDGVSVEASGIVSVDLGPGAIDNPEEANAPSIVSEKSSNYYEIEYPASGSKIEIGDVSGTGDFKPDLTVSAWDGESEFRLISRSNLEGKSQYTSSLGGDTISASNGEWDFKYQPTDVKEGFNDRGGIDIFITARAKPASNRIEFSYLSDTDIPHFQPPLTEVYQDGWSDEFNADIIVSETQVVDAEDGSVLLERPEHVVNSIAIYSATRTGNMTALNGKNYRTGKVGHLYRMKAVDALGKWTYADWSLSDNTLALVLDPQFLDMAAYPVRIEPFGDTFGYESEGGTVRGGIPGNSIGLNIPASGAAETCDGGTGVSMSICARYNWESANCQMALYTKSGSTFNPVTNGTTGAVALGASKDWKTANFTVAPSLADDTEYYLCWNTDEAHDWYEDQVTGWNFCYYQQTYGDWDPFSSPTLVLYDNRVSIYCTYIPQGGTSISNTPSSHTFSAVGPNATLSTGLNHFSVTNNSGSAVNITISGTDLTGGTTWTLSDTATPGVATYGMKAGLNGGAYNVIIKKNGPYNTLKSNLADSASQGWGFQILSPTEYTDSIQKTGTITLTASTS